MAVGRREFRRQQQVPGGRFKRRNQGGKPNPIDARQNLRNNLIVKSDPGVNNLVQIYTPHFDARNKINAKKGNSSQQYPTASHQGIARKALNDVRKGAKRTPIKRNGILNNQQSINKKAKRTKNNITGIRETTFTGISIKVSTANELAPKERKTLVKGKSLSVIAKNGNKTSRANRQLHKTINNNSGTTWIGPNLSRLSSPEPIAAPTSKKSIPAKVVISNLHPNVTQEDILELFGAIGPLREGRLKSVGTAEVTYRVAEDAFAAYSKYHGRNLDGQPMILKITTAEESGSSSTLPPRGSKYGATSSSVPSYYSTPAPSSNNATSTLGTPVVFTVKL